VELYHFANAISRKGETNAISVDGGVFQPDSPARKMQVGWLMVPSDIDRWIDELLPSFKH